MTLPDAPARLAATTEFDTNLVVLAGAGTGKTSLLVERFLNAIGGGRATIERIAAITFTDKAAAEMRERVAEGLDELRGLARGESTPDASTAAGRAFAWLTGNGGVPAEEVGERALQALERLDQAKVMTIHGFSAELLRAHPAEAGVDPDFVVDTGEQAHALLKKEWEAFLAKELGPEAGRVRLWTELVPAFTLGRIAEVAGRLAGFGIPEELHDPKESRPGVREALGPILQETIASIDSLLERETGLRDLDRRWFGEMREILTAASTSGLEGFREAIAVHPWLESRLDSSSLRPRSKVNRHLTGVSGEELEAVSREAQKLARHLQRIDPREGLTRLLEALAPFLASLRETYLRSGWVSFDGLLALSRNLLRDHLEIRRRLKQRYACVFVDEFQDTDPLQYEIVLYLAEQSGTELRDPYESKLEPGKLFIVGDPKQSIYRFRGADYGAFKRAIGKIVDDGGRQENLVASFRSVEGVTGPINAVFEEPKSTAWNESPYQPHYESIRAVREQPDDGPRTELWTLDVPGSTTASERRRAEGRLVAEEIQRLVEVERKCGYEKISILFRTFASIPYYLRPLRERGIPFVVDGGKDFIKRPEISQSLAVLRTLAQPSDPAALLAFLRSPAGGVSDVELAGYAQEVGRWYWTHDEIPEKFARIRDRFAMLRDLSRQTRQLSADQLVRRVVDESLLLPLSAAGFEGAQRVANLQKLTAAATELARDGRLSLEEVVDALQEGALADFEADSPLADDKAEAVRITSIHKMKGLENDWVFLPDLARADWHGREQPVEVQVVRTAEGRACLGLKIGDLANPAYALHDLEKMRHEKAEETRVFYVGLTRARERLVLVTAPARSPGSWISALGPWSYRLDDPPEDDVPLLDGRVLHRRMRPTSSAGAGHDEPASRSEPALERYEEAKRKLEISAVDPFRSPSAEGEAERPAAADRHEDRELAAVPRASARSRDLGKAVGIVWHKLLEGWDGKIVGTLGDMLHRLAPDVAHAEGLDAEALETEAREILERFADSALAERFHTVEILGREMPILLGDESGRATYRGNIDLLYRDSDGRIVVADYKTDREEQAAALVERYRPQILIYAKAVQQALGLLWPPVAELWLLRSGERVRVE